MLNRSCYGMGTRGWISPSSGQVPIPRTLPSTMGSSSGWSRTIFARCVYDVLCMMCCVCYAIDSQDVHKFIEERYAAMRKANRNAKAKAEENARKAASKIDNEDIVDGKLFAILPTECYLLTYAICSDLCRRQ